MIKKIFPFLIILPILFGGCDSASKLVQGVGSSTMSTTPSNTEIINGLKQALENGIGESAKRLSVTDAYFKNNMIKVLFPPEAQKVESTLRNMGLGNMVDNAIESFNRAAERAAKEAAPIFVNAIKSMTVNDAKGILLGADDSATNYLKSSTYSQLQQTYMPIVQKSLDEVNATKYWEDVITRYNKIPLIEKVNPDLTTYVTQKALDGLFFTVVKEEQKIRQNAAARNTDLLRKVFGYADSQK
jgi:uncharacterized protein YejL (UPF0352 family)